MRMVAISALFLALVAVAPAAVAADGGQVFKRCAACHLPSGKGVPGAFPPLDAHIAQLAQTRAGRQYLILVVIRGRAGSLMVDGSRYVGVMPPQTIDDAATAAVLNHVLGFSGNKAGAFSAAEVVSARRLPATTDLSALRAQALAQ